MILDADVERWLREDVGHHDVSNDLPGRAEGRLVAREDGVVAGLDAAAAVLDHLGCEVATALEDGDAVAADDELLSVEGPTRDVLRGERVAANLVGHAAGVATATHAAVEAARGVDGGDGGDGGGADEDRQDVVVACTRKTTPGLRGVEKRAVAAAGGDTHRLDMSHAAMVKDNHVAALGLERAVERVAGRTSFTTPVEVEVTDPADAERAAAAGADAVLFDNMAPEAVERGVEMLPEGVVAEASGGIRVDDVPAYAATGVDVISIGALTHSAPALDVSFLLDESAT